MPVTWEIGELDDGLRVVTTPVPTSESVSVNLFVGAGARSEKKKTMGVAHFLEHMAFKGTTKRPNAIIIAETIEGAGGSLNAYTGKELTCYYNHVPFDQLETGMDVLADMLHNSLLEPEEIDRERTVVQQEIRRTKDQPGAYVGELLGRAFYGDQEMGWPTAGTEETVEAMKRPDFAEWMDTWYSAPNMVLSIAGNTTHEEVMALATRYFKNGTGKGTPKVPPLKGTIPAIPAISDVRDITQANVALAVPGISRKDPDRYPLMILNAALGRGMSSRLFKEVRERRGLAYSVGSSVSRHADGGMVAVSAGVSPENLLEAIKVIFDELEKMAAEAVGQEELQKAKDYTVGSFRLSLESTMSLGQRAGESLLMMGEIEPVEEVVRQLRAVTADDVMRVAKRLLDRTKATVAVVGPKNEDDEIVKLLQR
jgi:predicted Zn-dependent peptidase